MYNPKPMLKFIHLAYFFLFFCFLGNSQTVFINEVKYLAEDPMDRGIELVNLNDTNLTDWKIYLYNSSGIPYDTINLVSPSSNNPFQDESNVIIFVDVMMLSTNSGSGVVLTDKNGVVVQYLTYCGGVQLGQSGPATGVISTDIGCQDGDNTPQLVGSGYELSQFQWTTNNVQSTGDINEGQSFETAPTSAGFLPVEWVNFTAIAQKTGVALEWITGTESDNDYFILERSEDGRNFEVVKHIESQGDNTSEQHYQYLDTKANRGINYYRISQKDLSNKIDTYKIIEVTFEHVGDINIYPNPAINDIIINLPVTAEHATINVFDRTGKLVMTQDTSADNGLVNMQVTALPAGYYMLVVIAGDQVFSKKLVKK